jgi:hypothetical protein
VSNPWTVIFPLGPETAASYLQKIQVDKQQKYRHIGAYPSGYSVTRFSGSPGRIIAGERLGRSAFGGLFLKVSQGVAVEGKVGFLFLTNGRHRKISVHSYLARARRIQHQARSSYVKPPSTTPPRSAQTNPERPTNGRLGSVRGLRVSPAYSVPWPDLPDEQRLVWIPDKHIPK